MRRELKNFIKYYLKTPQHPNLNSQGFCSLRYAFDNRHHSKLSSTSYLVFHSFSISHPVTNNSYLLFILKDGKFSQRSIKSQSINPPSKVRKGKKNPVEIINHEISSHMRESFLWLNFVLKFL